MADSECSVVQPDGVAAIPGQRPGSMSADILWTTVTSVALLFANFLLSALLARRGAMEVYEPYSIVKRIAATGLPFLSLGLTVGVVKYVAASHDPRARASHTVATTMMVGAVTVLALAAAVIAPGGVSRVLLGFQDQTLLWAVIVYTCALTANALVFAFYRGECHQSRANWTNLVGVGVLPLVTLVAAPRAWSAPQLLFAVSGLILLWNGGQLLWRTVRAVRFVDRSSVKESASALLGYSLPRIPSGVAMGALVVLPPWFARQSGDTTASMVLLAALSSVQVVGASVQSFGVVLLPRMSALSASGDLKAVQSVTSSVLFSSLLLSAFVTPVAVGVMPVLIPLWLGAELASAVPLSMLSAATIPAIVLFNMTRSIADGVVSAPVNTYATVGALLLAVLGMAVGGRSATSLMVWYVLARTAGALSVAAVLTSRLHIRFSVRYIVLAAAVGSVIGMLAFLGGKLVSASTLGQLLLLSVAVVSALSALVVLIWRSPSEHGLQKVLLRQLPAGLRGYVVTR